MRLRPQRRLLGIALAAGVVYLFATNSEVVWLYVVAGMMMALLPVGIVAPLRAVRSAVVVVTGSSREGFLPPLRQDRDKAFAGDTLVMRLHGADPAVAIGPLRLADGTLVPVEDRAVPGGRSLNLTLGSRGEVAVREVRVSSDWPLGMFRVERWVPLRLDVLVHPRYWIHHSQRVGASGQFGEESHRRGEGDEFLGVRDYRPGDSRRRIHWRTTARTGSLMVAETAAVAESPLRLGLKLAPGSSEAADLAVSIAASVAAGGLDAGRELEVDLGDRAPVRRWGELMARLATFEPGGGGSRSGGMGVLAAADTVTVTGAERSLTLPASTTHEEAAAAMESAL